MNTVESIIKEELGKTLVDIALKKIKSWAKKELDYIRHAIDYPVCMPINESVWVIGDFTIYLLENHRYMLKRDNKEIHIFYSKKAVVLYAVFEKLHSFSIADDILRKDKVVAKLFDDLEFYTAKIMKSNGADQFKKQLWQSRYFHIKLQFVAAKRDLEKTLESAKYNKIWEKIL